MLFSRKKKKLQETPNADFDPTSYSPEELVTILKEWERNSKAHPEIEAWYKSSQAGHVPPWHETQATEILRFTSHYMKRLGNMKRQETR